MQKVNYKKRYVDDDEGRGSSRASQSEKIHRNWCSNALMSGNEAFSDDYPLNTFPSCSIGFAPENRSLACGERPSSTQSNWRAISGNGRRRSEETAARILFSSTQELSVDNPDGEDNVLQQLVRDFARASEIKSAVSSNGNRRNEETAVKSLFSPTPELSRYNSNGEDRVLQQLIQDVLSERGNMTSSQNQTCRQSTSFNVGRLSSRDRSKFTLLEQNLNAIIRNFKKCEESCMRFLSVYTDWSRSRRETITQLIEIAEDLGIVKSNCNVAAVTGHSVGTAGTIISIAGTTVVAVAAASTPVGAILAATGFAVGMAGGLTSLTAAIARSKVQHEKIKKAQQIYEKDSDKFLVMAEWFKHCCTYQEAVKELMDIDVFQNILTDTKNFVSYFVPEECKDENQAQKLTVMSIRFLISTLRKSSIDISFVMSVLTNPNLREILKELIRLHYENPVVFEGIATTAKIFSFISVAKDLDMGSDIVTTVATKTATSAGRAVGSTVGKVVVQGTVLGISLAIDLTGVILTSIEIHEGSKCPQAKRIFEAIEKLADEYHHLRKVYGTLQKYKRNTVSACF